MDEKMPEPPDLQALVRQYGGYAKIPDTAWATYDDQMQIVHGWLGARHKVLGKMKP